MARASGHRNSGTKFASTYSYLSAMRLEEAATRGRRRRALAPVSARAESFSTQGLEHLAVQSLPRQGALHVARHGTRGCPDRPAAGQARPPFPRNSLTATRVALLGADEPWGPQFTRAVYRTEFGERPLHRGALRRARPFWRPAASDPDVIMKAATGEANKNPPARPHGKKPARAIIFRRSRPSLMRMAKCSGAMIAWKRLWPGRRGNDRANLR